MSDALLFVLGFPVIGLAWEIYDRRGESRFLLMVSLGLFTGGVVFLSGRVVVRAGIESMERFSGYDLNRDGVIGAPEDRIILVNKRPEQQAHDFAEFVEAASVDPTERRLLSLGFTNKQITLYRDALIDAHWAEWVSTDRRHGWRVTADAGAILKALPSPIREDDDESVQ
jgi:hypothetical protein